MASSDEQLILGIQVKYEDAIFGVMRFQEKLEELKDTQKKLKEQFEDGNITYEEYQKQTTATNAVITQYKENVRVLKKELQNNVRQEQEMEGSLKQLRAQLSNATKAFDEMSKVERESAKGRELQNHIKELSDEIKEAEEATGRFYRNVGNYKGSIMDALGINNNFARSLADIATNTNGIKGFFSSITGSVKGFGAALAGLASNPVFLAIAGIAGVGVAFKWWYDYNEGLQDATRYTKEFFGFTGERLESLRNAIQATADVMGKDFLEVLQTVDAMSAQWGIDAESSLKIINDGFAAGADLSGDMLSKIQQYAPIFRDAGIRADELVAIIAQTRSGIFSDKGMDIISMASKKIREMSTATAKSLDAIGLDSSKIMQELSSGAMSTFDVVKLVAAKIKELPQDSQKVGEVLKDVFGKQGTAAGLELIKQLDTMTTSIEDVKEVTGEWGELTQQQIDANKELNDKMSDLFDATQSGFEEATMKAKLFCTQGLVKVLSYVQDGIHYLQRLYKESEIFRASINLSILQWKAGWTVIKGVMSLFIRGFERMAKDLKAYGHMLEGVLTFDTDKISKGWSEFVSNQKKQISDMWHDVRDDIGDVADRILNLTSSSAKAATTANHNLSKISADGMSKKDEKKTKSSKVVKSDDNKAQKLQEEQLKKELLKIQVQYNNEVLNAKQKYIAGMFDSDKDYEKALEELQKSEIMSMLNVYLNAGKIGEAKAQEMSEKLLDMQIQARAKMKEELKKTISDMDEEFNKAEAKRRESDILSGGTGEDTDESLRLQRYEDFLNAKLQSVENNEALTDAIKEKYHTAEIDRLAEEHKKTKETTKKQQEAYSSMLNAIGDGMAEFFEQENITFKGFFKQMLILALDATEKAVTAQILAKQVASSGFAGIAKAAVLTALVKSAFSVAKTAVKSFSVGGYVQGDGTGTSDSIPARLSNGESVMTAAATSMFSPLLSAFNQLGGGVPIVVNNGNSQMGEDLLAAAIAKGFQMCPSPVVSVAEITSVQKRIQTIENLGRI